MKKKDEIKVCLVGSSGGHLTHLYMLKPFWKGKNADCPETTPERAVKFRRVNPPRNRMDAHGA